jgi:hypothetical protein
MLNSLDSPLTADRQYVREAAALLDRVVPGWAARVDTATLDLTSSYHCVLGQVFGDYGRGDWLLRQREGFSYYLSAARAFCDNRDREQWVRLIEARRAA